MQNNSKNYIIKKNHMIPFKKIMTVLKNEFF